MVIVLYQYKKYIRQMIEEMISIGQLCRHLRARDARMLIIMSIADFVRLLVLAPKARTQAARPT